MIRVYRGPEPRCLGPVRTRELAKLRQLALTRPIEGGDIKGYDVVKQILCKRQHGKCCYCERLVVGLFNDVEHFRPKGRAVRAPGCAEDHGYHWLAFTWKNLLFACEVCNRTSKVDLFPLGSGSQALKPWEDPPGAEKCLLLDPAVEHGAPHIEFVPWSRSPKPPEERTWKDIFRWEAKPRASSERGLHSIKVFGLNHAQYQDPYLNHVRDNVSHPVEAIRAAIAKRDTASILEEVDRARRQLLTRSVPCVGLSYDALRHFVPDRVLAPFAARWPAPQQIGYPTPARRPRR